MSDPNAAGLGDQLESLERSLDEHRDELRAVRDAIDELRDVLDWIARNPKPGTWHQLRDRRIVSMPLDPTTPDFAMRVNTISPDDLRGELDTDPAIQVRDEEGTAPSEPASQQELF